MAKSNARKVTYGLVSLLDFLAEVARILGNVVQIK